MSHAFGSTILIRSLGLISWRQLYWSPLDLVVSLQWRRTGRDGVSNHQPDDCLLNRLFRRRSKKTSKLRVTDHYEGNSSVTGEFPAQMVSNAENVSIWWRHHGLLSVCNQAITWTNVQLLKIGSRGTNFDRMLIETNKFPLNKIYLKILSAKWQPLYTDPSVTQ